jgi:hypothetical protein
MAGKIIADQIEHSTAGSLDTSYVVNGSAKARVTGSDAAAIVSGQSLNISSGTDHGTGDYSYAFASNLDSASYSGAVSPHGGGLRMVTHSTVRSTTSVFAFYVATYDNALNNHGHSGAAFGDLA